MTNHEAGFPLPCEALSPPGTPRPDGEPPHGVAAAPAPLSVSSSSSSSSSRWSGSNKRALDAMERNTALPLDSSARRALLAMTPPQVAKPGRVNVVTENVP
ncbi:hypothetical protein BESB_072010 [Besnoitia besnoiti]|uniref:Uncharacterized protein n=1 Tax=Besnoitia besnoiti TaxID=94643 RepID=A0A2A9M7Z7_BESBE|nr:uncharacterized protein BESB_072010 [Besnoitia besnoiti]PFH34049.1 hypothetical protein BESB_072010 [Besnoitia besnoiti]